MLSFLRRYLPFARSNTTSQHLPNHESVLIPLKDADLILSVFGVVSDSREYSRWKRDDGFRLVDFEDVLGTSARVLNVDWKDWLPDAVDQIVEQLAIFGFIASAEFDESGERGQLCVGATDSTIYFESGTGNFDDVILTANSLILSRAAYRKFRACEGTDGWEYAILSHEDWRQLETDTPYWCLYLFENLISSDSRIGDAKTC